MESYRWKRTATRLGLAPVAAALCVLVAGSRARADYPVMSHRYLADPGSLVYDGRIYLYNSNDDDNAGAAYTMHSVVCVSTTDLKNWTDHGVVFQVPEGASWANNSWAPQPITRDGKIYLYFGNSASGIGVASSSSPTGGFKDAKGSYLVNSATPGAPGSGSWLFDPGAFIDDDGQAYLSFGGNGETYARIIKLGSDLVSVSGSAAALSPTGFYEASFLFKRKSNYYFAYSSDSSHGLRIDYLMSSSPQSGYTYTGVIADQPPVNDNNNHASEFEFKGQWYHAYHNRSVSTAAGIATTYKRNLAIEVLDFKDDGTIKQVSYTTDGVPQIGTLNPYGRVEAETFNAQSGIETETCSAGGMNLTQIANGDWVKVRGVNFGSAGAKTYSASVASTAVGGSIELHLDSPTGTLIGTCAVPATGGAQVWMNTTCDVSAASGVKDLVLKFVGGSFNVDYWQFTGGDGGTGGTGGNGSAGNDGVGGVPGSGGAGNSGSAGLSSAGSITGGQATGGSLGTAGGTSSSGGSAGKAGTGNPAGGSRSSAGSAAPTDPASCSCGVVGSKSSSGHWLALALGLAFSFRKRHRGVRRRRCAADRIILAAVSRGVPAGLARATSVVGMGFFCSRLVCGGVMLGALAHTSLVRAARWERRSRTLKMAVASCALACLPAPVTSSKLATRSLGGQSMGGSASIWRPSEPWIAMAIGSISGFSSRRGLFSSPSYSHGVRAPLTMRVRRSIETLPLAK